MAKLSRPLIGGIACLILLLAVALNNDSTLIVMLLVLLLGLNIAILISNFKNIKTIVNVKGDAGAINDSPNTDQDVDSMNLPDPLEKGFDLPL